MLEKFLKKKFFSFPFLPFFIFSSAFRFSFAKDPRCISKDSTHSTAERGRLFWTKLRTETIIWNSTNNNMCVKCVNTLLPMIEVFLPLTSGRRALITRRID